MSLVLEHNQPFLFLAIYISIYNNTAGINFFRLVKIIKLPLLSQGLHAHYSQVHQSYIPLLGAIDLGTVIEITIICALNNLRVIALLNIHQVNSSSKCGMAAMVRPVSVYNPDFSNSRISSLGIPEICLAELQVFKAHSKTAELNKVFQHLIIPANKAMKNLHIWRSISLHIKACWLFESSLAAFNCIDVIGLNSSKSIIIYITYQNNYSGSSNIWTLLLGNQLNTLCC